MNHAKTNPARVLHAALALALLASCRAEIEIPKDPPEARKDYARTALDTPVTLDPGANDFDPNGEVMTVVAIGQPANGVAVLNPDGSVDYTPNTGFTGGDSFTVTIVDASGHEATESAYVTVGDSVRFLYTSNSIDYNTTELYLSDSAHPGVPIPVSAPFRRTRGPVVPGMGIDPNSFRFTVSPDGSAVVYAADDLDTRFTANLFFVDLDAPGVAIKLTDFADGRLPLLTIPPKISPDNQHVYYTSNEVNPDAFNLMRVAVAAPLTSQLVTPALTSITITDTEGTRTVWETIPRYELTPDGSRIVYVKSDPDLLTASTGGFELYSVDTATLGAPVKLSGTVTVNTGGPTESSITGLGFRFVPNGTTLLYPAVENGTTNRVLWLVDWANPAAPVQVSATGTTGSVSTFKVSPDGTKVVYEANDDASTKIDLYLLDLATPGTATQLGDRRTDGLGASVYQIGYQSDFVVFVSDDTTEGLSELYYIDFAAPATRVTLNHALRPEAAPNPAEEVRTFLQLNPSRPREVLFATNDEPIKFVTRQTIRLVSVDAPGVTATVGSSTLAQFAYMWHPTVDDMIVAFDDPRWPGFDTAGFLGQVVSGFEMSLSDANKRVKLTPEEYPGASLVVNFATPFLP